MTDFIDILEIEFEEVSLEAGNKEPCGVDGSLWPPLIIGHRAKRGGVDQVSG